MWFLLWFLDRRIESACDSLQYGSLVSNVAFRHSWDSCYWWIIKKSWGRMMPWWSLLALEVSVVQDIRYCKLQRYCRSLFCFSVTAQRRQDVCWQKYCLFVKASQCNWKRQTSFWAYKVLKKDLCFWKPVWFFTSLLPDTMLKLSSNHALPLSLSY